MFKIVSDPQFTHDVPVMVPVDDGHAEQSLRTRFRVLDDEARSAFDLTTPEGTKDFLHAAVVGFEGLVDDEEKPLPVTDALREKLIGTPYVSGALSRHYFAALYKARLGN